MNKKFISLFEICLILLYTISFSYLVSTDVPEFIKNPRESKFIDFLTKPIIPLASANPFVASGCCLETNSGAICQEMNLLDSSACKAPLIGTSCNTVEECQTGCCYDGNSGICSLNAPKEKCVSNGGEWNNNAQCNIQECQLGCCMLGDSASLTTTLECTNLANQYNFQKDFRSLDSKGSCDAYVGLSKEGACLTPSPDFSNQKNCVLTTKGACSGEFKQGYLCTSQELNTGCKKTTDTSCIEGKDEIYFLDSCGNKANIYDAAKVDDQSYWEKIISNENTCASGSNNCGNCDYSTGSICKKYESGKDQKPQYGNNVCRNLDCPNGKKHGESWCVSDYNSQGENNVPIGARNYLAKCMENEISLEPCADFNQEICIQSNGSSYSQARCLVNDWRTCLQANEKDTYEEVKLECDQNPQCTMFLDIPGNEKYIGLPGFKDSGENIKQGNAGDIGKDQNKVLAHCVPKYAPGFQFWTTPSNPFSTSKGGTESTNNYGGSKEETNALCSMGSFTCVSHIITDTSIAGGNHPKDAQNPECNIDAVNANNQKVPLLMEALNERCRSIGSCGTQANIQGQFGANSGFTVKRIYIDKEGKQKPASEQDYILNENYLQQLSAKQAGSQLGSINTLSDLTQLKGATPLEYLIVSLITGKTINGVNNDLQQENAAIQAEQAQTDQNTQTGLGALSILGEKGASAVAPTTTSLFAGNAVTAGSTITNTGTIPLILSDGTTVAVGKSVEVASTSAGQVVVEGAGTTTSAGSPAASSALSTLAIAAVAMIAAYFVGKMIAKSSGMSPAESNNFVKVMMAGAALAVASYTAYTTAGTLCGTVIGCWVGLIVAIVYFVYSLFAEEQDHEYYILEYTCQAWEPPKLGDCSVCNSDVRPCSENKCKSLGNNCHYFVDNGEPGYCASLSEIWKASITPWQEVLTQDNKYSAITDNGFKIESNNKKEVAAWLPITFGIITDKQAICKIGLNYSATFDQMSTQMISQVDSSTGKVDGMHHQITLSPHVTTKDFSESESTTLPIESGENNYYIKCKNFAGQENEAAFAVRVNMAEGPDLMEPRIVQYVPADNSYLKYQTENFSFFAYVNEPATCKYSIQYDYNAYAEMPYNMTCVNGASAGYYGQWPCYATLENLSENINNIYIKCKDQPSLIETDLIKKNENDRSFVYTINKCAKDLEVSISNPIINQIIEGKNSVSFNLTASTSGCVNGGDAICSFQVDEIGNFVTFLQTGGKNHVQAISGLTSGDHKIKVECADSAGNIGNTTANFKIFYDNQAPEINRVYLSGRDLILRTNEQAECIYEFSANGTGNCDFNFNNARNQTTQTHVLKDVFAGNFYIKCRDNKLNEPFGCTEVINVK